MPPREDQTFHVEPTQVGATLSGALRKWLTGRSWSQITTAVQGRQVLVNGNLCTDAGRRLKASDVVKVLRHPAPPPPTEQDVRVRHLDEQVVVVEKPSGVTSIRHAEERDWPQRRKQIQPTLEELLGPLLRKLSSSRRARARLRDEELGRKPRSRNQEAPTGKPMPVRPVHRLDRETSGLMVFARTIPAERHLGEQFRNHTTHRRYLAVVIGKIEPRRIESRLIRDRGDGRRGSTRDPNLGKIAVTHIRPLEDLGDYTLIECRLETGRTHQIRIHLAEMGHPLCGEKVYNQPLFDTPYVDNSDAPRIALHAAELGFVHPSTGEKMTFEMPLPDDLQKFIEQLRRKRDKK